MGVSPWHRPRSWFDRTVGGSLSSRSPSLRAMDERCRQGQRIPRTQLQVDRSGDDGPFADDVDVYPPPVLMERRRRHPEPTVAAARLGILEGKFDHVLASR